MIIGITGGIGSGKSVIAKQLRQMGYEVYDTDSEAKRLIVEDAHVREQITALFGPKAYKDGVYQTAFVAQQVFNSPPFRGESEGGLLSALNAIVHPAVRQDIVRKFRSSEGSDAAELLFRGSEVLFFIECAILYTAHLDQLCDKVVAVTAPEDIRLKRVIARDHSDIDKVRARMRAQNVEEDIRRADIIINNDGNTPISILCEQILKELT